MGDSENCAETKIESLEEDKTTLPHSSTVGQKKCALLARGRLSKSLARSVSPSLRDASGILWCSLGGWGGVLLGSCDLQD